MKTHSILLMMLLCLGVGCEIRADQNEPVLPGHRGDDRALIGSGGEIVIGKFVSLGFGGSDAAGATCHERAQVEVVRVLTGIVPERIRGGYYVVVFPANERETVPIVGTAYIMFIRKVSPTDYEIAKLKLATDKNVKAVEDLIAARDQGGSG